jgi:hypothetical protein
VSSDDFKSLEIQFLVHFILDLIDHNEFGIDSFKISSGKLQYKSTFGTSDNFRPSFDISDVKRLLLLKLFYFLMNLIGISLIPNPPVEFQVKNIQLIIHAIR